MYTPKLAITLTNGNVFSIDPFVVSVVTTDTVDSIASKIVTGLNAAIASKTTQVVTFSKVGIGTTTLLSLSAVANASVNSISWDGMVATQVSDTSGSPIPLWQDIPYQIGSFVRDPNNNFVYRCISNTTNAISEPSNNPTYWALGGAYAIASISGLQSKTYNSNTISSPELTAEIKSYSPVVTSTDLVVTQSSIGKNNKWNIGLPIGGFVRTIYDAYKDLIGDIRIGTNNNKSLILGSEGVDAIKIGNTVEISNSQITGASMLFNASAVYGGGIDSQPEIVLFVKELEIHL